MRSDSRGLLLIVSVYAEHTGSLSPPERSDTEGLSLLVVSAAHSPDPNVVQLSGSLMSLK